MIWNHRSQELKTSVASFTCRQMACRRVSHNAQFGVPWHTSDKDSIFDFGFVVLQSQVQNCVGRMLKTCPIDKNVALAISSVSVVENWEFHTLCLRVSLLFHAVAYNCSLISIAMELCRCALV